LAMTLAFECVLPAAALAESAKMNQKMRPE
jgi:hypothetical protein